jgi:hypothetical protein
MRRRGRRRGHAGDADDAAMREIYWYPLCTWATRIQMSSNSSWMAMRIWTVWWVWTFVPSGEAEEPLLPAAVLEYMSVVGSVNYVASSFRPDVSVDASILGRAFARPTIRDSRKANAALAWIQQNRYPLRFRKGTSQLTAFCDSAGPSDVGTQGCRLFALTDNDGHRVCGWIYWESKKVKRVCRSSATGEVLSLGEAYDTGIWLKQLWLELPDQEVSFRIVVDSMGVAKNIVSTKLPSEKRLRIDLAVSSRSSSRRLCIYMGSKSS